MSSPAHIVDPCEGPVSKLPGSLPPGWEPVGAFSRELEYAETQQNPPPEVVCYGPERSAQNVPAASHVGSGAGVNERGFEHDARSSLRPDIEGNKEPSFNDTSGIEPPELPWYRTISRTQWAAIVICLVGSTAVVLAILGAMNRLSGDNSSSESSHSADETATTNTASSSTSTTTAAKPTSTTNPEATKIDCSNSSTFLSPITWIGAELSYTTHFSPDSDAESCCNSCLHHDPGCAGWLYNTTNFTPCTKIVLNTKHDGQDDEDEDKNETCPQGYTDKTYFTEGTNGKGSVAGLGPCSRMIKMQ